MLDWKRRQNELQHRWGLAEVEENAKPRKEFVEQLHSHKALADPADRSCLTTVQQCDAPVEVISQMGKVEVEYNSRWMHYSRRILTVLFIAIGAFIVIFTSLGDH
jgi:hypothetical protein